MAATAYETLYRDEWIAGYERDQSMLRSTVSTDAIISGRDAVFLIATSNREAVTRGPNGLIPAHARRMARFAPKNSLQHLRGPV